MVKPILSIRPQATPNKIYYQLCGLQQHSLIPYKLTYSHTHWNVKSLIKIKFGPTYEEECENYG